MATLKQIQAKLKKLQAQAETLIADRAQAVLDDIRAMMERHGLTTADIDRHGKAAKRAAKKPGVAYPAPAGRHEAMTKLAKKGKLPAKYRNPKTGETWSGWARPPAWIANVKDRSKFLIDAEGVENAAKPKAAAKKAAAKKTSTAKTAVKTATKTAAKKAKTTQTRAPAAKKAAAPAAKKTGAAKPAVKRTARKQAATNAATTTSTAPDDAVAQPQTTDSSTPQT
ncbi:histone family protein nucleoid-structuring protein H-NS [Caballeronia hypogeia]|uniref:Histone family protein nucleoid-structuring protein H-NS n=1 Tax=Caballeronia hypogeia TaxID=1777140 RepID=A0A158AKR1_9BURK|nr:H-NS histone family protein [Caballeronia hypogeia]SAK58320.1 histone family protein nucleoid-structuring protein H-NS [Caballeronia hypogeia]